MVSQRVEISSSESHSYTRWCCGHVDFIYFVSGDLTCVVKVQHRNIIQAIIGHLNAFSEGKYIDVLE